MRLIPGIHRILGYFIVVFIFCINVYAQENPDTLFFNNGKIFPCKIENLNTVTMEIDQNNKKHTVLVKILNNIFIAGYGSIEASESGIQQYLDSQEKLSVEKEKTIENPDTLYLKSGLVYPCLIEDLDDQKVSIVLNDKKHTVLLKLLDEIYLYDKGTFNPSDPGLKALVKQQESVSQQDQDIYSPDKSQTQVTMISLGGGISKPLGEGSEYWESGFTIYGDVFFRVSPTLFIGGHIAYNRWSPDADELASGLVGYIGYHGLQLEVSGSATIIEFSPSLRVAFSSSKNQALNFFGHIGVGMYVLRMQAEGLIRYAGPEGNTTDFSLDESETKFGLNIGAGMVFGVINIYPLYTIVFTENESTKYFSINLGFVFGS